MGTELEQKKEMYCTMKNAVFQYFCGYIFGLINQMVKQDNVFVGCLGLSSDFILLFTSNGDLFSTWLVPVA